MFLLRNRVISIATILSVVAGAHVSLFLSSVSAELINDVDSTQLSNEQITFHVDPVMGQDLDSAGSIESPLKTITYALSIVKPGATIKLKSGTYSVSSGEKFPLLIPSEVKLIGNEMSKGEDVVIIGGGLFASSWWGRQNSTIFAKGASYISGVTITNPETRGTGIWIESSSATVKNCLLTNNLRDGIFVAGNSSPTISSNKFLNNSANGITVSNQSMGVISSNHFEQTGFGVSISEDAAPEIKDNRIQSNVDGIVISHRAKPTILGNYILNNQRDGIVMISQASPMLGSSDNPGRNAIKGNGRHAVHNATSGTSILNFGNNIEEKSVSIESSPVSALPVLESSNNGINKADTVAEKSSLEASLTEAKSISIDGKKYISIEDMLRLLK